jgi:hypothetical protein
MNYLQMLDKGIALLPVWPTGKNPKVKSGTWDTIGGIKGWITSRSEAKKWNTTAWGLRPENGGFAVLDVDRKNGKDGIESLKFAFKDNPAAQDFLTQITSGTFPAWVQTPSGGFHFYFRYEGLPIKKVNLFVGVEFFNANGYVLAPGSIKNDKIYQFYGNMEKAPDVPDFLFTAIKEYQEARAELKKFYSRPTDRRSFGFNPEYEWKRILEALDAGTCEGRQSALFRYSERASSSVYNEETKQEAITYIDIHAGDFLSKPPEAIDKSDPWYSNALRSILNWHETPDSDPFYGCEDTEEMTKEEKKANLKKRKEIQKKIDDKIYQQNLILSSKDRLSDWLYNSLTDKYFMSGFHTLAVSPSAFSKQYAAVIPAKFINNLAHEQEIVKIVYGTTYLPARESEVERLVPFETSSGIRKKYNTYFSPEWPDTNDTRGRDSFLLLADHLFADEEEKKYAIEMLAWMLQNPGKKLMTALLLVGEQGGSGKTIFLETFERLMGKKDHEGITLNVKRLTNNALQDTFTGIFDEACLIHIEELKMKDKVDFVNSMKDKITGASGSMRKMRTDPYMVKNYYNFVASTNYEDALYLDTEDDRRWYMATCHNAALSQDLIEVFSKAQEIDDIDFYASVYKYLKELDTAKVENNRGKSNMTPAKSIMFEKSSSRLDRKVMFAIDDFMPDTELVTVEDIINRIRSEQEFAKMSGYVEDINPGLVEQALKKNDYEQHNAKRREKRIRLTAKGSKKPGRHRVFIHPEFLLDYNSLTWEEFVKKVDVFYHTNDIEKAAAEKRASLLSLQRAVGQDKARVSF